MSYGKFNHYCRLKFSTRSNGSLSTQNSIASKFSLFKSLLAANS